MLLYIFLFLLILYVLFRSLVLSRIQIRDITNRYVFITGCDTGFGNLLAKKLDSLGVKVIAGCFTDKGRKDLEAEVSTRLKTVPLDVSKKDSVERAFEIVKSTIGEQDLWGVVNNAGIMPNFAPAEWIPLGDYETTSKVNYLGTVSVCLTFLPLLRKSKGRIVNVCSVAANCPYPGATDYSPSKAAVKAFSIGLRRELYKTGVTVHIIEPGAFKTNITEKNRLINSAKKAYNRSSSELQQYYGGSLMTTVLKTLHADNFASTKPQLVADAMTEALLSKYPKSHYSVGIDAKTFFRIITWLPDFVGDFVLGWPAPYGELCEDFK